MSRGITFEPDYFCDKPGCPCGGDRDKAVQEVVRQLEEQEKKDEG